MIRTHYGQHPNCFGCKLHSIQLAPSPAFKPHFNWAVGEYVNSDREFKDKLAMCSERASNYLGLDHDFQPRYPGDLGTSAPYPEHDENLNLRAKNIAEGVKEVKVTSEWE